MSMCLLEQTKMVCRFFDKLQEMEAEANIYRNPVMKSVLPELLHADANAGGALQSGSGFRFPPYLVRICATV